MKEIQIDHTLDLEGTIIDFETTHYDVKRGELITAGFLSQKEFTILQRLESTKDEFRKKVIKEMKTQKKPWYAFVKKCEESFCGLEVDYDLQENRESAYIALKKQGLLRHYNLLCDPLFNEEISEFWNAWNSTKNLVFLSKIVRHNYCCLAKEYYLKLRKIDKLDLDIITPFLSSAPVEKLYIRDQLGFSLR